MQVSPRKIEHLISEGLNKSERVGKLFEKMSGGTLIRDLRVNEDTDSVEKARIGAYALGSNLNYTFGQPRPKQLIENGSSF